MNVKTKTTLMIALFFCSMLAGCAGDDDKPSLVQTGSSTVLPLAVVWAEDYQDADVSVCLLYTSPSPRDPKTSRMPSSA